MLAIGTARLASSWVWDPNRGSAIIAAIRLAVAVYPRHCRQQAIMQHLLFKALFDFLPPAPSSFLNCFRRRCLPASTAPAGLNAISGSASPPDLARTLAWLAANAETGTDASVAGLTALRCRRWILVFMADVV